MDAHDSVLTRMDSQAEHRLLLVIHVYNGLYRTLLRAVEPRIGLVVNAYVVEQCEYVSVKQRQHTGNGILYELCPLVFALYDIEVYGSYAVAFRWGRFADLFYSTDLIEHAVNILGTIFNQINVSGIHEFCIGTGGVDLEICRFGYSRRIPAAIIVFGVVFLLLPGFLCQFKSKGVDVIYSDSLSDGDEQRWVENRLIRILGQTAHILHVLILLNGQYGLYKCFRVTGCFFIAKMSAFSHI